MAGAIPNAIPDPSDVLGNSTSAGDLRDFVKVYAKADPSTQADMYKQMMAIPNAPTKAALDNYISQYGTTRGLTLASQAMVDGTAGLPATGITYTSANSPGGATPGTGGSAPRTTTTTINRSTTHQNILDPTDAANLSRASTALQAQSGDMMNQLKAISGQITGDVTAAQTATLAKGAAQAGADEATGEIKARTNENQNSILNQYGITNSDGTPTADMINNQAAFMTAQRQRLDLAQQIQTLKSTDPTTNPLGWLVNNLKTIPLIQQHNAAVDVENTAEQTMNTLKQGALQQQAIQPGVLQDQLRAQAHYTAAANLAGAQADSAKLGLDGASLISRNLLGQLQAGEMSFSNYMQVARINEVKTAEMQGVSEREIAGRAAIKELDPVNSLLRAVAPNWKGYGVSDWKDLDKTVKDNLTLAASAQGGNADLGTTIVTLNKALGPNGLNSAYQSNPGVGGFIQKAVRGAADWLASQEHLAETPNMAYDKFALRMKQGSPEQTAYAINKWADQQTIDANKGDMQSLPASNPYKLNLAVGAALQANRGNDVAAYVQSQAASPTNPMGRGVTDQDIFTDQAAKVANGKNVKQAAKDMVDFYWRSQQQQNNTTLSHQLGMPYMNSYVNRIDGNRTQMLNYTSVENALTAAVSKAKAQQAMVEGLSGANTISPMQ